MAENMFDQIIFASVSALGYEGHITKKLNGLAHHFKMQIWKILSVILPHN